MRAGRKLPILTFCIIVKKFSPPKQICNYRAEHYCKKAQKVANFFINGKKIFKFFGV